MSVLSFFCDGVDVEMQAQLVKMFAAECPKCIQSYATWQMGIHDYEPLLRDAGRLKQLCAMIWTKSFTLGLFLWVHSSQPTFSYGERDGPGTRGNSQLSCLSPECQPTVVLFATYIGNYWTSNSYNPMLQIEFTFNYLHTRNRIFRYLTVIYVNCYISWNYFFPLLKKNFVYELQ